MILHDRECGKPKICSMHPNTVWGQILLYLEGRPSLLFPFGLQLIRWACPHRGRGSALLSLLSFTVKTVKKKKSLSHLWLYAAPWTVAHQAPPSTGFSRQEYWGGLPFPPPGDLPSLGMERWSPPGQADSTWVWAAREALEFPCNCI